MTAPLRPSGAQRHPHLADERRAGTVRVDLHVHTMWSGDSTTTPEEFERAIVESGLDVVCITDHHAIAGALHLRERLDCRVIVGEEIRSSAGEIIGLFLSERIPAGMSPRATAIAIREQNGVVYIPHPFDPMRRHLSETALVDLSRAGLVDAVEVLNAKTSLRHLNERAAAHASEYGLFAGAGSDAHVPDAIGAAYVEMPDFDDRDEFLAVLAEAQVIGHHWDEPRPWSPRIVPSMSSLGELSSGRSSPDEDR